MEGVKKVKITTLDLIFTFFILLSVMLFSIKILFFKGTPEKLIVKSFDSEYVYNLSDDQILNIPGAIGVTKIEIKGGKFKFLESPCLNKNCIHTGWVGIPNYPIVCLPNRVSAFIEAKNNEKGIIIDSVSQ